MPLQRISRNAAPLSYIQITAFLQLIIAYSGAMAANLKVLGFERG